METIVCELCMFFILMLSLDWLYFNLIQKIFIQYEPWPVLGSRDNKVMITALFLPAGSLQFSNGVRKYIIKHKMGIIKKIFLKG